MSEQIANSIGIEGRLQTQSGLGNPDGIGLPGVATFTSRASGYPYLV